jgi:hypothetical protein
MCDMNADQMWGYVGGLHTAYNTVKQLRYQHDLKFQQHTAPGNYPSHAEPGHPLKDRHDIELQTFDLCMDKIQDFIHKYEPGHDKPANSF